jgi:Ca2+-binding EF-hand superfamily protein
VRARAADQEDALFTALDADGDGRLNAREMRQAPAQIRAFDRNGDGKVHADEIPGSMIIAFVRGNPQQDNQLFTAPGREPIARDESLPRWFRGMDSNRDGEVSRREFFGTAEAFAKFDQDHDGFLSLQEARATETAAPSP